MFLRGFTINSLSRILYRQRLVSSLALNYLCTKYDPLSNYDKENESLSGKESFYNIVHDDLITLQSDIIQNFNKYDSHEILPISKYYFELKGKSLRPAIVCLISKICNAISNPKTKQHNKTSDNNSQLTSLPSLSKSQLKVATFTEMVHTSSLLHDDVIDKANIRRCSPSANHIWGQRKPVLAGNFVLALASQELARLRDTNVTSMLSKVLRHLVDGEMMQLGTKDVENERFDHYLRKTFNKTGSLVAYSCKAVAYLSDPGNIDLQQAAFECGKGLGVAFQLRDDILDFVSSSRDLGKPSGGHDLLSGLATGPLLFACDRFPYLEPLILRRFSRPGDVEKALTAVQESDGVQEAQRLADCHSREALNRLTPFMTSSSVHPALRSSFASLCKYVVERDR